MLERIPGTEDIELKPKFVEHYKKLCGPRYDDFLQYSFSYPRRSIRVNTLKSSVEQVKELLPQWKLDPIPWIKEGFWVSSERRDIGNTAAHMLGAIYVQEAASMIPPLVLNPEENSLVLDMAASPGSKSTQLAAMMNNTGLLIANDINAARMKPLGINMQRSGAHNMITTRMMGQSFRKKGMEFDHILLDAPCSGTGTIRKSLKTVTIWNPGMIERLARTQTQLLDVAYDILKAGQSMVYSTCSCEPQENEAVIDHLLQRNDGATIEKIDLPLNRSKPILELDEKHYASEIKNALRIWPQDNDTEGFFVCKIRKE